jgi:multidrug efflux pump subunit AcrA (membrane-fusion protein)
MGATLIGKTRGLHFINAAFLVLAGSLIVAGACNYGPEAPTVDQATLWMDTVKRGDLAIERRGAGQLFKTESGELIAQLRVPESQSLDLEIGQTATVDLRIAEVGARVTELGDEIVQGTRMVRLEFTEEVPEAALPGMSIDASIQVDILVDVLYVGKPAYGQSNSRLGLFKLVDDGGYAERVSVQTGRSSVNMIEITEGLEEGDQIILSDMSRWDAADRLALR